ncbi:hypothetical protein AB0D40_00795 [Streptomyces massasporeus]|uniref:hypothetical protein n=1 Tax=Streptomyces massasporeus TaxID=67324 RepID=UPI003403F01E
MDLPSIKPGLLTTRAAMHELFGGGSQGGIITPKNSPNILIYVDHDSGKKYGYEDGWLEEEDERGPVFEYTGQGTRGHQTFLGKNGSRNGSVLRHAENGKSLQVFMAAGKVSDPASSAKQQRYIGEFELDSDVPYVIREARDEKDERRRIIVFRLRPKGEFEHLTRDVITRAQQTDSQRVSPTVITCKLVEPKKKRASESRRAAQPSLIADLRQSVLREKYLEDLTKREHDVFAYQVKISGTTITLKTDLYDATEHELYAIRGASSREQVHVAIGQLKDFVRHIKPHRPKLTVLLPEKPQDDLLNLLHAEGIDLVYGDADGYTRCPAK